MKHFMQPQTAILRKAHSTDPLSTLSPSLAKPRPYRKAKLAKENAPPSVPNSMAYDSKQSPAMAATLKSHRGRLLRILSIGSSSWRLCLRIQSPGLLIPAFRTFYSGKPPPQGFMPSLLLEEERAEREAERVVVEGGRTCSRGEAERAGRQTCSRTGQRKATCFVFMMHD
uniref:Uncharacterized protein n=1 Tax=Fagus sylvatica TaxID=28930 RepID=A0A2N9EP67_FAGSY